MRDTFERQAPGGRPSWRQIAEAIEKAKQILGEG